GVSDELGDDRSWRAHAAIAVVHGDLHDRIELAEGLDRDVEAGHDTARLRQDDGACLLIAIDGRLGGDIAPAEILGQRAADQLAVDAWIQRLEGHALHATVSDANSSTGSATSANDRSRMCEAARKSRAAGSSGA